MNTYINNILKEFVRECSKKLDLKCILQFGSSTYSKNPQDIDLAFFSKDIIFSTKDILELFKIIKKFELKYKDMSFDFSGNVRKKKRKFHITVIPLYDLEVRLSKNSNITYSDSFFFKNLAEDKNKKVLFGKDPFDFKIKINKTFLLDKLPIEIKHTLRRSLDDTKSRLEITRYLFKTTIRMMLVNEGIPEKEKLLDLFKKNYTISLPKNAEKIMKGKLVNKDFEDVLKFAEDCLRELVKD